MHVWKHKEIAVVGAVSHVQAVGCVLAVGLRMCCYTFYCFLSFHAIKKIQFFLNGLFSVFLFSLFILLSLLLFWFLFLPSYKYQHLGKDTAMMSRIMPLVCLVLGRNKAVSIDVKVLTLSPSNIGLLCCFRSCSTVSGIGTSYQPTSNESLITISL